MKKTACLVIAAFLATLNAYAGAPAAQTVIALHASNLGVRQGNNLLCFRLNAKAQWESCGEQPYLTLPDNLLLISANTRKTSLITAQNVEFFENRQRIERCSNPLPAGWDIQKTFISGGLMTECELVQLGSNELIIMHRRGPPEKFFLDCAPPAQSSLYFFGSEYAFAFITPRKIEIHQITQKADKTATCAALPQMQLDLPENTDEAFVIFDTLIGLRQGKTIRFLAFDFASKKWGPALTPYFMNLEHEAMPIPDFEIPEPVSR